MCFRLIYTISNGNSFVIDGNKNSDTVLIVSKWNPEKKLALIYLTHKNLVVKLTKSSCRIIKWFLHDKLAKLPNCKKYLQKSFSIYNSKHDAELSKLARDILPLAKALRQAESEA